jgi:hypothetical protein
MLPSRSLQDFDDSPSDNRFFNAVRHATAIGGLFIISDA